MQYIKLFYTLVPHSSKLSPFQEKLDCNFGPLWVKSGIEHPVVHHRFEPARCLLRPVCPIHRRHLRVRKQTQNTMNSDNSFPSSQSDRQS